MPNDKMTVEELLAELLKYKDEVGKLQQQVEDFETLKTKYEDDIKASTEREVSLKATNLKYLERLMAQDEIITNPKQEQKETKKENSVIREDGTVDWNDLASKL